jgi:hypothetical protein
MAPDCGPVGLGFRVMWRKGFPRSREHLRARQNRARNAPCWPNITLHPTAAMGHSAGLKVHGLAAATDAQAVRSAQANGGTTGGGG